MKKSRLLLLPILATLAFTVSCEDGSSEGASSSSSSSASETTSSSSNGGDQSSSSTSEEQPYVPKITEPTTISIWTTMDDSKQELLNSWIEDFKEIEPNVTINNVKQSGDYTSLREKIVQGFAADNYPDITYCYPDHVADYINYNKALDLTDYVSDSKYGFTEEEISNDFVEAFWQEGSEYSIPGIYSLPFGKSTEAMFYNADALIDLDLSTIDKSINGGNPLNENYLNNLTWEELFNKLCPAIVKYNETVKQIIDLSDPYSAIVGYDSDDNFFITLAEQYGYDYTSINQVTGVGSADFNNDEMKDLMKMFYEAASNKYLITAGSNADGAYTSDLFKVNKTLFGIGSTAGAKHQIATTDPFPVGVAQIPGAQNGNNRIISQGPSMTILRHDKTSGVVDENRAWASFLFYKYITNTDNGAVFSLNSNYAPVRYSSTETEIYQAALAAANVSETTDVEVINGLVLKYFNEVLDRFYVSPVFVGSSACRDQAGSIMTQVMNAGRGKTQTDETLDSWLDGIFSTAYNEAIKSIK